MDLIERIWQLTERVETLEAILGAVGIPTNPWLTPAAAANLIKISPTQIRTAIAKAEAARDDGVNSGLIYGIHYRNVQAPESQQPSWQVNVKAWQAYLSIPPEKRC